MHARIVALATTMLKANFRRVAPKFGYHSKKCPLRDLKMNNSLIIYTSMTTNAELFRSNRSVEYDSHAGQAGGLHTIAVPRILNDFLVVTEEKLFTISSVTAHNNVCYAQCISVT